MAKFLIQSTWTNEHSSNFFLPKLDLPLQFLDKTIFLTDIKVHFEAGTILKFVDQMIKINKFTAKRV